MDSLIPKDKRQRLNTFVSANKINFRDKLEFTDPWPAVAKFVIEKLSQKDAELCFCPPQHLQPLYRIGLI